MEEGVFLHAPSGDSGFPIEGLIEIGIRGGEPTAVNRRLNRSWRSALFRLLGSCQLLKLRFDVALRGFIEAIEIGIGDARCLG